MEKTMTLNLRVSPAIKQQAEAVLKQLGVPMSTAVDMFLRQVALTGGIPFEITLPKASSSVNADAMSVGQLREQLRAGYADVQDGKTQDAVAAFKRFREAHK